MLERLVSSFYPFALEALSLESGPEVVLRPDEENAKLLLGKTAQYEPGAGKITVYISGRHPKDIGRSISHEMVHYAQDMRGEFDGDDAIAEDGYAQSNDHLRSLELEAYERGNIIFRDWEDSVKQDGEIREDSADVEVAGYRDFDMKKRESRMGAAINEGVRDELKECFQCFEARGYSVDSITVNRSEAGTNVMLKTIVALEKRLNGEHGVSAAIEDLNYYFDADPWTESSTMWDSLSALEGKTEGAKELTKLVEKASDYAYMKLTDPTHIEAAKRNDDYSDENNNQEYAYYDLDPDSKEYKEAQAIRLQYVQKIIAVAKKLLGQTKTIQESSDDSGYCYDSKTNAMILCSEMEEEIVDESPEIYQENNKKPAKVEEKKKMKGKVTKEQIRQLAEGVLERMRMQQEMFSDEPTMGDLSSEEPVVDDLDDLCYDAMTDSMVPCDEVGMEDDLYGGPEDDGMYECGDKDESLSEFRYDNVASSGESGDCAGGTCDPGNIEAPLYDALQAAKQGKKGAAAKALNNVRTALENGADSIRSRYGPDVNIDKALFDAQRMVKSGDMKKAVRSIHRIKGLLEKQTSTDMQEERVPLNEFEYQPIDQADSPTASGGPVELVTSLHNVAQAIRRGDGQAAFKQIAAVRSNYRASGFSPEVPGVDVDSGLMSVASLLKNNRLGAAKRELLKFMTALEGAGQNEEQIPLNEWRNTVLNKRVFDKLVLGKE